jgi:hypothetical protein
MPNRDRKIWRPLAAKRAEAAAAETRRRKFPGAKTNDASAARAKRKAKGLTRLPKRLSALS